MPKICANKIQLNYEIRGKGPRLLFIHGIGADMKNPIGLFNSPMVEHFTILSYDPRGLGESESPEAACTMSDLAKDAAELAKAVGWEKYHVFGASMGGMVAQELAIQYPDSIDKLVLAVTHSGKQSGAPILVDKMLDFSPQEMAKTADTRQDEHWSKEHPEILERMKMQSEMMKQLYEANPALKKGYRNQVGAVINHDTTERLSAIQAETLVFNGKYDGSMPISVQNDMAEKLPHGRFELVDHGHGSWFFDPKVWEMVISFLEK